MRYPSHSLIFLCISSSLWLIIQGQGDDGQVFDQEYLQFTQNKVHTDVVSARDDLIHKLELVRGATREFIGAKIKENLFRALKTLAEREMESIPMQDRPRQPRQDEDDDDDLSSTTERGILPQLATIVQTIFGPNVNVTKYVESASKLLPRPIGSQIVGVVSLLDPNKKVMSTKPPVNKASGPVTPPPLNPPSSPSPAASNESLIVEALLANETEEVYNFTSTTFQPPTTTVAKSIFQTTTEEDDDDSVRNEEDSESGRSHHRVKRQGLNFKGVNPMKLLDGFESIWKNFGAQNNATGGSPTNSAATASIKYTKAGSSTTESDDGFDDDYTTKRSRVTNAVSGVAVQVDALRKGVPDLFLGAREAYKFLGVLNGFLDTWESRLQTGLDSNDDDE